jgi:hypothetical protein
MLAASVSLVAAQIWLGRGAALGAALFFIALRGVIALIVGPIIGNPLPHFPLYLVEAAVVELVPVRAPLRFGLICGALIGTVGLAAEWGWSQLWMPLPWPAALFPVGALLGLAMALAGALIGAWLGARLAADELPERPRLRAPAVVAAVAIFALAGYGLYCTRQLPVTATVTRVGDGATIVLHPRDAADHAQWLTVTSWQGGGLDVDRLHQSAPGVFHTTKPMPTTGQWKTMVRLHSGYALTAVPVYLPADPAIPVGKVAAPARFTRPFGNEHKILQREQKTAAGWLWAFAYGVVFVCALGFLVLLAWGVHRVSSTPPPSPRERRFASRRTAEPLPTA